MADQWDQVNSLFLRAVDLADDERSSFLASACAGDEELRRNVESLLASHDQSGQFLEEPLIKAGMSLKAPDSIQELVARGLHASESAREALLRHVAEDVARQVQARWAESAAPHRSGQLVIVRAPEKKPLFAARAC